MENKDNTLNYVEYRTICIVPQECLVKCEFEEGNSYLKYRTLCPIPTEEMFRLASSNSTVNNKKTVSSNASVRSETPIRSNPVKEALPIYNNITVRDTIFGISGKTKGTLATSFQGIDNTTLINKQKTIEIIMPNHKSYLFNLLDKISIRDTEYWVTSRENGDNSVLFYIFKNKENMRTYIPEGKHVKRVYEKFKEKNFKKYDFLDRETIDLSIQEPISIKTETDIRSNMVQQKSKPHIDRGKGRLATGFSEMKNTTLEDANRQVEITMPDRNRYSFDLKARVEVGGVEYWVVSRDRSTELLFFVFRNSDINPVYIPEGKAVRRVYRKFMEQHYDEYEFIDGYKYDVQTPKNRNSSQKLKHLSQDAVKSIYGSNIPKIIEIPSRYSVVDANAFGYSWSQKKVVKQITIPNSVVEIHSNAFVGLLVTDKVIVPDSVNMIGENAFVLGSDGYVACNEHSYAYNYAKKYKMRTSVEMEKYKKQGVCQYCGGEFTFGLFRRKCKSCGKMKDY